MNPNVLSFIMLGKGLREKCRIHYLNPQKVACLWNPHQTARSQAYECALTSAVFEDRDLRVLI
jgi:hypothetical protein